MERRLQTGDRSPGSGFENRGDRIVTVMKIIVLLAPVLLLVGWGVVIEVRKPPHE